MPKIEKKQTECLWTLVATSTSVDINSNALSIFNIIEEITSEVQLPMGTPANEIVIPMQYELISLWQRSAGNHAEIQEELSIEILSPGEKVIQTIPYTLVIPSQNERMRLRLNINGFKIEEDGKYTYRISIKEGEVFKVASQVSVMVKLNKKFISPVQQDNRG